MLYCFRYLFCMIGFKACHRPGVIQSMTLQSYLTARKINGQYVIAVLKHKTAEKPALVVLSPNDFERLTLYHNNLRKQQKGDNIAEEALFFIKYENGIAHDNVTKEIADFQNINGYPSIR